ncbi:MAG: alginate export family protein [Deltaproteobacteria bacterium]|nr:MAG: alginate export family protein [Deltaproteobacteria bacterium]
MRQAARKLRTAAIVLASSAALVVALGTGHAPVQADSRMAQFQLPPQTRFGRPIRPVTQFLRYQYSYGSESEVNYRRNPDLDDRIRDNLLLLKPQLNGMVIYRPASWLETTLEVILEREFAVHEEKAIPLPNGETQFAPKRRTSLLVDQAFVTIKGFTAPFEFHVGRRNYEDERHWLYDTSMDTAGVSLKQGPFRADAVVGREVLLDLDLLDKEVKDRIDTCMLTAGYRGIEDIRLGGYVVFRDDRAKREGRPLLLGVSAHGMPSDRFSFWTQLASLRGSDELRRRYSAHAFDVGSTFRFTGLPFRPSVTLGYAYASGDGNPDDGKNSEFRQTGLQSNEWKFDGVSDFKVFGETLDPELGNLKILTAGLGFRPAPNVSVDFVYHRYRLDEIADALPNSALTAKMNQDDTQLSKDVGAAVDLVIGIRNPFGIRRLGLDLRNGLFLPGSAFRNAEGAPGTPAFRKADRGSNIVAKFWW